MTVNPAASNGPVSRVATIKPWWVNQPCDTLCYVSPARFAVSSLTSAKRITRLILRAIGYAGREEFKKV